MSLMEQEAEAKLRRICAKILKNMPESMERRYFESATAYLYRNHNVDQLDTYMTEIQYNAYWVYHCTDEELASRVKSTFGNVYAERILRGQRRHEWFTPGPVISGYVELTSKSGQRKYVAATDIVEKGMDVAFYDASSVFMPQGPEYIHQWAEPIKIPTRQPRVDDDIPF